MKTQKISNHIEKSFLIALSKGDTKAFDKLFRTYYPKIKKFLSGFIDNTENIEDLTQDLFLNIWKNRKNLIHVKNLNAYLYRASRNILYNSFASQSMQWKTTDLAADIPSTADIEEQLISIELKEFINEVIEEMPKKRQKVFKMSRKKEMSNSEIAQKLNLSKRTIETHISTSLTEIRNALPYFLLTSTSNMLFIYFISN